MRTKLTKNLNIEISKGEYDTSKLLKFKNEIKKILYLMKLERRYFDESPIVKFYIFGDSYILYIEEINVNFNINITSIIDIIDITSIIDEYSFYIFTYYPGIKDMKTFEFKYNMLKI